MSFVLDPEIAAVFAVMASAGPLPPRPARGDWRALRQCANTNLAIWAEAMPEFPDVETTAYQASAMDGASLALRWYKKTGAENGPAVVFAHGGALVAGNLDLYDPVVAELVNDTGVPFLAVEYRLAPEAQGETPAEDAYTAIVWLTAHAAELGVDPGRIAVMGDSGGGAVIAGATILARDRGVKLAQQILIYPMLDDRNQTPDPHIAPFLTFTYDGNFTGWSALLGEKLGRDNVSAIAAPARLKEFEGLPPTYIEVGELDIFRDEDVAYAQALVKVGVSVELHVHPGAPHGFDRLAPRSALSLRAKRDRIRAIRSI
jgi:acetyl esterase/lipase